MNPTSPGAEQEQRYSTEQTEPDHQVVQVDYYPLSGVTEVEMASGTLLHFFRVPHDVAADFKASTDKNAFYAENIEGQYTCQRLG